MKGKEKCKILKEIRAQIAAANDIAWVTEECPHKGDCRGTCPKCEAEVRKLERELERRRALGKTVAVVGLSAGLIVATSSCAELSAIGGNQLDGDMIAPASTTTPELQGGMTLPPDITDALDGDIDLGGVPPLPPVTTEEIPELGGEPLPVYYLTDFTLYDSETMYVATGDFNLYDVVEGEEGPSGITESMYNGDFFMLVGDNGTEESPAWLYLVRCRGVLYAIDEYDLTHFAKVYAPADQQEAK